MNSSVAHTSIFLLLLCTVCLGGHDLSEEYRFSSLLDGDDYVLHWNFNLQTERIEFAVNVSTQGWVGFGISPNGQMPGSDVVIGWVDSDGKLTFHDRFASTRSLPAIDSSQDWFVTSGEEENGRTILEFYRNFTSCDTENDMDIKADTARVVWSYNAQDPSTLGQLGSLVHDRQGSESLNFLGGNTENRVESQSSSIRIINNNVTIPSDRDTTYWCTVHELPESIEQQERYIYKFSPVIHETTKRYVHHIVAYLCTNLNDTHVGASQHCSGSDNIQIGICRFSGILFAAWAIGGTDFVFPSGVGYPFGGRTPQYIVLEIHYDNPGLDAGNLDSSGLELFYVNEQPAQRAGLLTFGQHSSSSLIIPPTAENFVVNALCPEECTREFVPQEGINFFGNLLHTHLAGHGLTVRHLRKTDTCSGYEELAPIDQNPTYDFNYQQTTFLPRRVKVLPGDVLHLQCSYRTTDPIYQNVVLGGESTREEMCFSFLYYYPETPMGYCTGFQLFSNEFLTAQNFNESTQSALISSTYGNNQQEVQRIFQRVEWNPETIQQFQDSIHSSDYSVSCTSQQNRSRSVSTRIKVPEVTCPYVPATKKCPQGPAPTAGAPCVYSCSPLAFISLLLLVLYL